MRFRRGRPDLPRATGGTQTVLMAVIGVVAFASLLGVIGLFTYQFLDPALSRSRSNRRDIRDLEDLAEMINDTANALKQSVGILNGTSEELENCTQTNKANIEGLDTELGTLEAQLSVVQSSLVTLNAYLNDIAADPPALFARAYDDNSTYPISNTFVQVVNTGVEPLTSANVGLLYNTTTSCIEGPGIEVNDTVIIKTEVSGTVNVFLALEATIRLCNGTALEGQGNHGVLNFNTGGLQTFSQDFTYTYSEEIEAGGGIQILLRTTNPSYTFTVVHTNTLVIRYRPLDPV